MQFLSKGNYAVFACPLRARVLAAGEPSPLEAEKRLPWTFEAATGFPVEAVGLVAQGRGHQDSQHGP
jgi:hypothetical protein